MDSPEIAKAKAMMDNARRGSAPEEVLEPPPVMATSPMQGNDGSSSAEMTVGDFLSAAHRDRFVTKFWVRKNKNVKIKRFSKGELDRISAPLMKKSMSIDIDDKKTRQSPKLEISMDIFSEMEKNLVEIGMCFYKDESSRPVISRHYIDTVMEDEDFKELSALIQEVNPKALTASIKDAGETEAVKNS